MAKTDTPRRRQRKSKVEEDVNSAQQTETVPSSEKTVGTDKDVPTQTTETKQEEDQDGQDSQMDIEVKGTQSTVTVSWKEKNEEEEEEKKTHVGEQMMDREEEITPSAETISTTEDAPGESRETEMEQETQESGESQKENESTAGITVTWEEKNEDGEQREKPQTCGHKQTIVKETAANGKRKAPSTDETSPSKKTKLINDGFCVFVGNLNNHKPFEEVKNALANYFMTQSLLVQDIRLDRSKKHAHVDLASNMDLTKALTLNGETVLEKPLKVEKAKIKTTEKVKVKASPEDKKAKDAKCLFLKNVPYSATKQDILKIFPSAIDIRFPGGTEGPDKGIAFVEFQKRATANKILKKKRIAKIQGRVLIIDCVGGTKVPKAKDDNSTKAAALPNNTLFVSKLSYSATEKHLKKVFQEAVNINIPKSNGRSKGFAFVEFATVADAEKVLQSSQNIEICKKAARLQFSETRANSEKAKVLPKTLIVMGLAEKTTAETLKSAFEGALSARVALDKETGVSKRFGFVEFESEETCKAAKDAMEDCEIDCSKVTVAYAKAKGEKGPTGAREGLAGRPAGKPADQGTARRGKGSKGGKRRRAGKPQDAAKEVENKG